MTAGSTFFVHTVGVGGATVKVFDGASLVAAVAADGSGFASAAISLTPGGHAVAATQTVSGQTGDPSVAVSVTASAAAWVRQGGKLTGADQSGASAFGADVASRPTGARR